ncbi:hypothetical protein D3C78_1385370 [compost metagenome]
MVEHVRVVSGLCPFVEEALTPGDVFGGMLTLGELLPEAGVWLQQPVDDDGCGQACCAQLLADVNVHPAAVGGGDHFEVPDALGVDEGQQVLRQGFGAKIATVGLLCIVAAPVGADDMKIASQ